MAYERLLVRPDPSLADLEEPATLAKQCQRPRDVVVMASHGQYADCLWALTTS